MIYSLNTLITNYIYYYPIKVFIIGFILLLWFFIYKLFKYKVSIDYKIYKPWLNWLAILIYIYLYVIYLLILRYLAWGKSVCLKDFYIVIQTQLVTYGILYIMLLLSLIILCLICLIRIRTVLTKELIKRHIWLLYYNRRTDTKYEKCLHKFANTYSYRELILTKLHLLIFNSLIVYIEKKFNKESWLVKQLIEVLNNRTSYSLHPYYRIIPVLILIILMLGLLQKYFIIYLFICYLISGITSVNFYVIIIKCLIESYMKDIIV